MKNKIDVSFIIPTYNRKKVILKTLHRYDNLFKNCFSSENLIYEIIVVDDGSSDGSSDLLRNLNKIKINLITLNSNTGPGLARNFGLNVAKGEWVFFLDDDDLLNEKEFGSILPLLKEKIDVICHSLKNKYNLVDADKVCDQILKNILLFKEKQEVFNFIFKRRYLLEKKIFFSPSLHEDIRFVVEALLRCSSFKFFPKQVVKKVNSLVSITSSMTKKRIDGYLQAFDEIVDILSNDKRFKIVAINEIFAQTIGVILYLISKERKKIGESLLKYLYEKKIDNLQLKSLKNFSQKDTNFKYAGSIWAKNKSKKFGELRDKLSNVFASKLSCKDLNSSIFFGPNEIRACCKRFFLNGERKGDTVLLKDAKEDLTFKEIQLAKYKLIKQINNEEDNNCKKCPYINRYNKFNQTPPINYISIEDFNYCNMKCTYCSPKYYGGKKSDYNLQLLLRELKIESENLRQPCKIVWGGGEPILNPRFIEINKTLEKWDNIEKVIILSNSTFFSPYLSDRLKKGKYHLVTSIDAGTRKTFDSIRKGGDIDIIFSNLSKYSSNLNNKKQITIKYIFTKQNHKSSDLENFVQRVIDFGLLDCMFQLSCDFRMELITYDVVLSIYELCIRLFDAGANVVIFDDLIRDRFEPKSSLKDLLCEHLSKLNLPTSLLITPETPLNLILWGKGLQSDWYKKKTLSGKAGHIKNVIADSNDLISSGVMPKSDDFFILPCAVQNTYEILQKINACGLSSHLLKKAVL